jgi:hypothetical protein
MQLACQRYERQTYLSPCSTGVCVKDILNSCTRSLNHVTVLARESVGPENLRDVMGEHVGGRMRMRAGSSG